MMPNRTRGRSFKGALAYVLHDKRGEGRGHEQQPQSTERVSFVEMENLPTDDPEKAYKLMAWTAMNAEDIKQLTGQSSRGRKAERPVWHVSLTWHPDEYDMQDAASERVQALQKEAGRDLLRTFGLQDHQAVMAGHADGKNGQAHLHLVVNLINPLNGKMPEGGLPNDKRALQAWAHRYEQERGHCFSPKRLDREGEFEHALTQIEQAAEHNETARHHDQRHAESIVDHLDYHTHDDFAVAWEPSANDQAALKEDLKRYRMEQAERRKQERSEKDKAKSGEGRRQPHDRANAGTVAREFSDRQKRAAEIRAAQKKRRDELRQQQQVETEREREEQRRRYSRAMADMREKMRPTFQRIYADRADQTRAYNHRIHKQADAVLDFVPSWARGLARGAVTRGLKALQQRERDEIQKAFDERIEAAKLAEQAERQKISAQLRENDTRERLERQDRQRRERSVIAAKSRSEWQAFCAGHQIFHKGDIQRRFQSQALKGLARDQFNAQGIVRAENITVKFGAAAQASQTVKQRDVELGRDMAGRPKRAERTKSPATSRQAFAKATGRDLGADALERVNSQKAKDEAKGLEAKEGVLQQAFGNSVKAPTTAAEQAAASTTYTAEERAAAREFGLKTSPESDAKGHEAGRGGRSR